MPLLQEAALQIEVFVCRTKLALSSSPWQGKLSQMKDSYMGNPAAATREDLGVHHLAGLTLCYCEYQVKYSVQVVTSFRGVCSRQ